MPGPNQHARYNRTGTIPYRNFESSPDPNWMKNQRQPLLDTPWCVANAADLTLAAGAPGAVGTYIFNAPAAGAQSIYDPYNIVGPVNTSSLRIPWDGIYEITGKMAFINVNTVFEWSSILQVAPTSNSGFGAPAFVNQTSIPGSNMRDYFTNSIAAPVIAPRAMIYHAGIELHANDLIQFQAQVSSTVARLTRMEYFIVKWERPIPNNMLTNMPNHI